MSNMIKVEPFPLGFSAVSLGATRSALVGVQNVLDDINSQLNGEDWQGESKEKCLQIHQAIAVYCGEIQKLCDSAQKNIDQLKKDANNFHANSSNVKMIQSI